MCWPMLKKEKVWQRERSLSFSVIRLSCVAVYYKYCVFDSMTPWYLWYTPWYSTVSNVLMIHGVMIWHCHDSLVSIYNTVVHGVMISW